MSITCWLFDLDGTLVDTNELMLVSYIQTLNQAAVHDFSKDQLVVSLCDSPVSVLKRFGISSIELYWQSYLANVDRYIKLYEPKLLLYLEKLRSSSRRTGVVTSLRKPIAKAILSAIRADQHFDTLVAYGDTRPHKPFPHPILKALSNLSTSAADCIYIGDQESDILAGKRAGVLTGVPLWQAKAASFQASEPDYYFSDFEDIIALAEKESTDTSNVK